MNIDDLEWQSMYHGGPLRMVWALLEQGHVDLVVGAAREREDWFWAKAAVDALCAAGEFEQAMELVQPFAEAGWRPAIWKSAHILVGWGRVEEGLALVRPDEREQEDEWKCRNFAELLVKAGRVDEAITLLEPLISKDWLLNFLVEVTCGQGRDERVLELVAPFADEAGRAGVECRYHYSDQALALHAQVLERIGRVDDAVGILGSAVAEGRYSTQNTLIALAELLARNRRADDLRLLATAEPAVVLGHYAQMLEDVGQPQEAEAVLRESIATHDHPAHRAGLMDLLKRQNRLDEAVEVGRPTYNYYDCWNLVHSAVHMLDENGRPGRAAELLEEYSTEYVQEHRWWILPTRWALMGKSGRCREAIAEITALPGEEREEWVTVLSSMLELDGRVDEAVELLRSTGTASAMEELADLLVRQGRPTEAIAAAPTLAAYREQQERRRAAWAGTAVNADGYSAEPPF